MKRLASPKLFAAAIVALSSLSCPAAAQNKVADIALYQGADRAQRILDGAKREGSLTLYSNEPTEDNTALVGGFEKKYGIKVNLYRASSEEIRQRMLNEYSARRYDVDATLNNAPAMVALTQEKILQAVKSPYHADLIAQAGPPSRDWVGFCINVLAQAYNSNLVKKADLPKSYQDLLDPKWKGKIAIEADDSDWFAGIAEAMGQDTAVKLFRDIAAKNGFSVRKGHTLLANLVSAGEVPLALTIFNYTAEQMKQKGAPVDWFALDPLVGMPNAVAVAANSPRPNAALLFYDFMLSDAQKILADRTYVVVNAKIPSPIEHSKLHILDAAKVLAEGDKWQQLYTQIISGR